MWSTEIAGQVTARGRGPTGLAEGTPVTAGTIDAAAEALSVGVVEPGDMMVMYGSTIFTIMLSDRRLRAIRRLWYAPWLFPGEHASMAGLATSGTLTHWFRDDARARARPADSASSALAAEAERSPPGARRAADAAVFLRRTDADPRLRMPRASFSASTSPIPAATCSARCSRASPSAPTHIFDTYREIGAHAADVCWRSAAAPRTRSGSQATSDISGLAQTVCRHTFGASYGDAFLAALAVGDVKLSDIRRWNPVARRIRPDPRHAALYRARYAMFQELYRNNRAAMAALS